MAADALSRISIDELKGANKEIFKVTTRGMSKLNQEMKGNVGTMKKNYSLNNIPIYAKFSHEFSNKIPKIRSDILYTNDKLTKLRINMYLKLLYND